MFGLTHGEVFVTAFIVFLVVSYAWWPRLGAALFAGRSAQAGGTGDADDSGDQPRI
jgi:hypothetical protein